jgi:hypothetical protein
MEHTRTVANLYRIAGILFAFTGGVDAFTAYREYQRDQPAGFYIAQAVTYFALCAVFIALARIKAREQQKKSDSNDDLPIV